MTSPDPVARIRLYLLAAIALLALAYLAAGVTAAAPSIPTPPPEGDPQP